jgi:DNA repair protein RecO
MSSLFKIEGIIIKRRNTGETDKIISVFTKSHGKITFTAKGIRKITSKRSAYLELINHINACVRTGSKIDYLSEVETMNTYINIKKDIYKIARIYRIFEQIDKLCPINDVQEHTYYQLLELLDYYNSSSMNSKESIKDDMFSLNLLWDLGYLERGKLLDRGMIIKYMEQITEQKLKSNSLLTKL